MSAAIMRFEKYRIKKSSFNIIEYNEDDIKENEQEKKVTLSVSLAEIEDTSKDAWQLTLQFDFIKFREEDCIEIKVIIDGIFSFKEKKGQKEVTKILLTKGANNLYSHLGAYVASISALSGETGTIAIPLIDFESVKMKEMK